MCTMKKNEKFDEAFEQFKLHDPKWFEYLTDYTYFELMDWYDKTYHLGNGRHNSMEATEFADYAWDKIHETFTPHMLIHSSRLEDYYSLDYMTRDELLSLHTMIKSAALPERRVFDRVKRLIEKLMEL